MSFEQRVQSATTELLQTIPSDAGTALRELKRERVRRRREHSVLVAVVLALVAAGWVVARAHDSRPPEPVTPRVQNGALVVVSNGSVSEVTGAGLVVRPEDAAQFSELAFTADGRLLVYENSKHTVAATNVTTGETLLLGRCPADHVCDFALSPDERSLAFHGESGLRIRRVDSGKVTRLPNARGWFPAWSPDGTRLAYVGPDGIYTVARDGGGVRRLYAFRAGDGVSGHVRWSPDGRAIAFLRTHDAGDDPAARRECTETSSPS